MFFAEIFFLREGHFYPLLPATIIIVIVIDEKQRRKQWGEFNSHKKTVEMNKVLIMPLKPQGFLGAMTTE